MTGAGAATEHIRHQSGAETTAVPLRLLLVEDSDADATLFRIRLNATSFIPAPEFMRARNIQEAKTLLRDAHPDCVLLDLGLPDSTGVSGVRELHSAGVPAAILVLTGFDDEATALAAISEGAQDYIVKEKAEGPMLVRAILRSIQRHKLVEELAMQKRSLDFAASHDPLTGLANRRALQQRFEERGRDPGCAVIVLDLDGFKPINDRYGHAAGDAVLKEIANRLRLSIRPQDLAARLGGDEFAVLTWADGPLALEHVLERLRAAVAAPIPVAEHVHRVTTSVGVAVAGRDGTTLATLLDAADRSMYADKAARKGQPT